MRGKGARAQRGQRQRHERRRLAWRQQQLPVDERERPRQRRGRARRRDDGRLECHHQRRSARDRRAGAAARQRRWAASCLRVDHRGVDHGAQLAPDRVQRRRHELGQKDDDDIFDRVDPERGRCRAAPPVLAHRTGDAGAPDIGRQREAEAEADAAVDRLGEHRHRHVGQVAPVGQVVGAHQLQRLRPEQALAVEFAAAAQAFAKAQVVGRGRDQPAAARRCRRRRLEVAELRRRELAFGRRQITLRQARRARRVGEEGGVGHAERVEDALLQEVVEGLARDLLDQVA